MLLFSWNIVEEGKKTMDDEQDSVDDTVEDAALLGDECEIKRDSVCVRVLCSFDVVL